MKTILDYVSTMMDSRQEKSSAQDDECYYACLFCIPRKCGRLSENGGIWERTREVFAMTPLEFLENFQKQWNEMLGSGEGSKIKRLLAIDGKAQRGNENKNQKSNHIVSAVGERGFCLGQKHMEEKTNEIKAIPKLLDCLNIKETIRATDAMRTQTAIVRKIRQKQADYVLALKVNQKNL